MSNIKKYGDWLLEKQELDVHTTMGKVDSKNTEKDFSKSLSSNYSKKDGTTSVSNKTDLTPKASKNTSAKTAEDTAPKEENFKKSKPSIDKSNPEKPEKKSLGKVGDVQISNDKIKKNEPSKKAPLATELEETAKKKPSKTDIKSNIEK